MAVRSYNRIFNTYLPDIAGELQALEMENDADLVNFTKDNIDNMNEKNVIIEDYDALMDIANSSKDN